MHRIYNRIIKENQFVLNFPIYSNEVSIIFACFIVRIFEGKEITLTLQSRDVPYRQVCANNSILK